VLLAKEETVLQGMFDKLTETGICYVIEMNLEKTCVQKTSKTTIPSSDYNRSKVPKAVEYFKYLGSLITNDARNTCEMKSRSAKSSIQQEEDCFH
jgi:hypothetical protein